MSLKTSQVKSSKVYENSLGLATSTLWLFKLTVLVIWLGKEQKCIAEYSKNYWIYERYK